MAEYGFRTRNTSSNVLIDSTYKNLALRTKLRLTLSGSVSYGMFSGSVAVTLNPTSVVAWRADYYAALQSYRAGRLNFRGLASAPSGNPDQINIDVFVFDVPDYAGLGGEGNYGLRVRAADGSVTFDSRAKYLRVLDLLSATTSANAFPTQSYNYPASARPAVVQGNLWWASYSEQIVGQPNAYMDILTMGGVRSISNEVQLRSIGGATPNNFATSPYHQTRYDFLVVDVSDL